MGIVIRGRYDLQYPIPIVDSSGEGLTNLG